ncbi:hypothetical protein E4P42_00795 [Mycobacterium sp. PS03-16]|uniref:hypothetical protein n=1 Tax=Mycobacterium sp. PS03-16 TaxID=2559611 RepID=UPI001073FBF6|nr:hypothetical protein [Mycobacterium sp. PS03-16]TFV61469.1 hypothetical protein E4P42_00795 [Mycobacterium sp. PS03-16]
MDSGFEDTPARHSGDRARVCRADGRRNLRRHRCRHRFETTLAARCGAAAENPVGSPLDEDGEPAGGERDDDE